MVAEPDFQKVRPSLVIGFENRDPGQGLTAMRFNSPVAFVRDFNFIDLVSLMQEKTQRGFSLDVRVQGQCVFNIRRTSFGIEGDGQFMMAGPVP